MQNGRITGELSGAGATEEAVLGLAMVDHLSAAPDGTAAASQERAPA
jgi:hypothetical protein